MLNRNGELVHVVHQYDRRKRLVASLGRRYALIDKPEAPPRTRAPVDTAAAFTPEGWPRGASANGPGGAGRSSRARRRRGSDGEDDARLLDGRIGVDEDNLVP